jgi:hypothetical protein
LILVVMKSRPSRDRVLGTRYGNLATLQAVA